MLLGCSHCSFALLIVFFIERVFFSTTVTGNRYRWSVLVFLTGGTRFFDRYTD